MTREQLDNLTSRQRHVYVTRFRWRWRLRKILQELGITVGTSALAKRAQLRAGPSPREASRV